MAIKKPTLTLEFDTLNDLAKAVVALSAAVPSATVTGGGAAVPSAVPAPAPSPTAAPAPTAAPSSAPTPTTAVEAQPTAGTVTYEDMTLAYRGAISRIGANGIKAVNAEFGTANGPLGLKASPEKWAGYIARLNSYQG